MRPLIKQILLSTGSVIVTLLVIAGIAFYLFEQSPIPLDEGHYKSEEAGHFNRNALEERKSLIKKGRELGLNKPLFYFSFHSERYPPNTHTILPLRERKAIRELCRKGWNAESLIETRKYLITLLEKDIGEDLKINCIQLLANTSPAQFRSEFRELQDQLPADLRMPGWSEKLQVSQSISISHFVPRFKWYGIDNRWHKRITDFVKFDWGNSWIDSRAVNHKIGEALPWTLFINGFALLLLFAGSIPLGRYWALHPTSWFTRISKQIAYFFTVAPVFWVATLSIIFLTGGFGIGLFPLPSVADFQGFSIQPFILPLLVIFFSGIGYLARQFEDQFNYEMEQDYIKMSLARGISRKKVINRYATKNALLPLITLAGASLPALISGSLVIEVLFNIPGMGRLIWFSLFGRDWPLIFAIIMLVGIIAWLGRWGADRLSHRIDPRTKPEAA